MFHPLSQTTASPQKWNRQAYISLPVPIFSNQFVFQLYDLHCFRKYQLSIHTSFSNKTNHSISDKQFIQLLKGSASMIHDIVNYSIQTMVCMPDWKWLLGQWRQFVDLGLVVGFYRWSFEYYSWMEIVQFIHNFIFDYWYLQFL